MGLLTRVLISRTQAEGIVGKAKRAVGWTANQAEAGKEYAADAAAHAGQCDPVFPRVLPRLSLHPLLQCYRLRL